MPAPAETVGLAPVSTGWTGLVAVTVGSVVAVARPFDRTSAAELWREVAKAAARAHGSASSWRSYLNAAGKCVIEGPSTFTLSFTGLARTRCGWSSTSYTGASTYTAEAAITSGLYFAGAGLTGLDFGGWGEGRPHSSGVSDVTVSHPLRRWTSGELALDGTMADLADDIDLEDDDGAAWDLWFQGRVLSRVRLGAVRLERRALGGTSTRVSLRAVVSEVT